MPGAIEKRYKCLQPPSPTATLELQSTHRQSNHLKFKLKHLLNMTLIKGNAREGSHLLMPVNPAKRPWAWQRLIKQEFPTAQGYTLKFYKVAELPNTVTLRVFRDDMKVVMVYTQHAATTSQGKVGAKTAEENTLRAVQLLHTEDTATTYVMTSADCSCRFWKVNDDLKGHDSSTGSKHCWGYYPVHHL